jgi:hypothetical protein
VVQVDSVFLHAPDAEQRKQLRRLGDDDLVIAGLSLAGGSSIDVTTREEYRVALLGPFGNATKAAVPVARSAQMWQSISCPPARGRLG